MEGRHQAPVLRRDLAFHRELPLIQTDLVCFSHLRWDFAVQRPQQLMSRAGRDRIVLFVEEAVSSDGEAPLLLQRPVAPGITVVVPQRPRNLPATLADASHGAQLRMLMHCMELVNPGLWYYTPMMTGIGDHLDASYVVYDCMEELSGIPGAPPDIEEREAALMRRAAEVFMGDRSLYRAKRHLHGNMHCLPSGVHPPTWKETWAAMDDHLQAVLAVDRVGGARRAGFAPSHRRAPRPPETAVPAISA